MPNKACGYCNGPLRWANGQSRCVDKKCPLYWKGQGGMETLDPEPESAPTTTPLPMTIRKPT